jgi:hypothetical protein
MWCCFRTSPSDTIDLLKWGVGWEMLVAGTSGGYLHCAALVWWVAEEAASVDSPSETSRQGVSDKQQVDTQQLDNMTSIPIQLHQLQSTTRATPATMISTFI